MAARVTVARIRRRPGRGTGSMSVIRVLAGSAGNAAGVNSGGTFVGSAGGGGGGGNGAVSGGTGGSGGASPDRRFEILPMMNTSWVRSAIRALRVPRERRVTPAQVAALRTPAAAAWPAAPYRLPAAMAAAAVAVVAAAAAVAAAVEVAAAAAPDRRRRAALLPAPRAAPGVPAASGGTDGSAGGLGGGGGGVFSLVANGRVVVGSGSQIDASGGDGRRSLTGGGAYVPAAPATTAR